MSLPITPAESHTAAQPIGALTPEHRANIRRYWEQPSGMASAPGPLAAYARDTINAVLDALEAANKRIAELEAELDAARRWYRL